jgi:hypothetical protein
VQGINQKTAFPVDEYNMPFSAPPAAGGLMRETALPEKVNGVIVMTLILRAGRNSPPAVNQHRLKARERSGS